MRTSQLSIECVPFARLRDEVATACGAKERWAPPQVAYLESYLRDVGAQTLIIEKPYIDRHYLEEYTAYYASSLRNGGSSTTRIHVFSEPFTRAQLSEWLRDVAGRAEAHRELQRRMNERYLGFLIVRPIPGAPIGRTVLISYRDLTSRSYIPSEGGHPVHLLGLELMARGLPFQQQDQAVGVCATTALWSAMSRVSRADGGRAPTPYAVTQAATRHYLQDRPLPAVSGLDMVQCTSAIRELGYAPYVLKPGQEHELFVLSLKCYLRSGIPALLVLDEPGGYHAVTASGYRLGDEAKPADPIRVVLPENIGALRSPGISRLYVHDDRFGPYVRMKLELPDAADPNGELSLVRVGGAAEDPACEAGGKICYAIFPLYPKLRLTARELIRVGLEMLPIVRGLLSPEERDLLNVEVFFAQGGRYQRDILANGLGAAERIEAFLAGTMLSRYVGIIRFQLGDAALADVVCDTTDIRRDHPLRAPVLAVFPFSAKHVEPFRNFLEKLAPWIAVV